MLPIEDAEKPEKSLLEEVATSALKLETARKISVSGDASGAALFDGTADSEIKITVKNSDRATKDANGNEISKTYAKKNDLSEFVTKTEIEEKINYLENILFATKTALNELRSLTNSVQNEVNEIKDAGGIQTDGENITLADDDDIDNLF